MRYDDDDVRLKMSIPLDSDGLLRRDCPTGRREFKWSYTSDAHGTTPDRRWRLFPPART